jgi:hypothetical protein
MFVMDLHGTSQEQISKLCLLLIDVESSSHKDLNLFLYNVFYNFIYITYCVII